MENKLTATTSKDIPENAKRYELDFSQQEEHRKAHICAIEDCMKAKRLLAGFGIKEHEVVLTNPSNVFDAYYNCDIETLHIEHESLCNQASNHVIELHPVGESSPTIFRELSEDEQDTED